jgi:sterol desaturase/sphingolipid hydroxylase (fatty acid hydroxylase superfamily)
MTYLQDISELTLRLVIFGTVFVTLALLELWRPKRPLRSHGLQRWRTNLSIVALGALVGRILVWLSTILAVPLAAVVAARSAADHQWGILNAWSTGPSWLKVLIALIVLDLAIYLQHVASHKIPLLWRIHRMHHADTDLDVTTALRFHPLEIGLSMLYKVAWVLALGPAVLAVILFELILNACAMFNHANLQVPQPLDRVLRMFVVTPDMHRIHHSTDAREHNSNYGFNLPVWDRLFATYTAAPRHGHGGMTIGLEPFQHDGPARLGWSLMIPFTNRPASILSTLPAVKAADSEPV